MREIVLLWLGVFIGSSVASAAVYELGEDEYGYSLQLENNDTLVVNGGGASGIEAYDSTSIQIHYTSLPLGLDVGGIYTLGLNDNSNLQYNDGATGGMRFYGDAQAVLQGGRIDHISSYQYVPMPNNIAYPHIEMVVRDWSHNDQTNLLTGIWNIDNDNNSEFDTFSIQLHDQAGYDPVIENIAFTVIPEPMTVLLFGFGGLAVCRLGKRKSLK